MNLGKPKVVDEEVITWYHAWASFLHEDSFTDLGPICTLDNVLTKSAPRAYVYNPIQVWMEMEDHLYSGYRIDWHTAQDNQGSVRRTTSCCKGSNEDLSHNT